MINTVIESWSIEVCLLVCIEWWFWLGQEACFMKKYKLHCYFWQHNLRVLMLHQYYLPGEETCALEHVFNYGSFLKEISVLIEPWTERFLCYAVQGLVDLPRLFFTTPAAQLESVWSYLHHDRICQSGTLVSSSGWHCSSGS